MPPQQIDNVSAGDLWDVINNLITNDNATDIRISKNSDGTWLVHGS